MKKALLETFHPELLSVREREVVDLAVEGFTDTQIATALGLTTSTVNSYWVRVRGKIGALSRTEIVAAMLRAGFQNTHEGLTAEVERLTGRLTDAESRLGRVQTDLSAERGESWHLLALHFVPDALLVVGAEANVVYANLQAERLFESEPGELAGCAMSELAISDERIDHGRRVREFIDDKTQSRMVIGLEEACYARCLDGRNFRVTIAMEGFAGPSGFMAVFSVREFLGDVDAVLKSLRKPIVVV